MKLDISTMACDLHCVFPDTASVERFKEAVLRGDGHLSAKDMAAVAFLLGAAVETKPTRPDTTLPPAIARGTAEEIEALAADLAGLP